MKVKGWHEGVGGMCKGEWIVYEGDGKVLQGPSGPCCLLIYDFLNKRRLLKKD